MFNHMPKACFRGDSRLSTAAKYGVILSLFAVLSAAQAPNATPAPVPFADMSGMYSFDREGEFVQINVEQPQPNAKTKPLAVTGFISRYADTDSDRGAFLDYFFSKGSLDGEKITFTTKTVHGLAYEFSGKVVRGKVGRDKDGYYEVRGTLTQNTMADGRVVSARSREITMKLYPELDAVPPRKKD